MNLFSDPIFHVKICLHQFSCNPALRNSFRILIFCGFLFYAGCGIYRHSAATQPHDPTPASQLIRFYQGPLNHLSAVRYGGCPMHPSCSAYAMSAIETHGPLIGWMMTFDRVIRCGMDETHLSDEIRVQGHWKYVDPLAQNDFWWDSRDNNATAENFNHFAPSPGWGISIE